MVAARPVGPQGPHGHCQPRAPLERRGGGCSICLSVCERACVCTHGGGGWVVVVGVVVVVVAAVVHLGSCPPGREVRVGLGGTPEPSQSWHHHGWHGVGDRRRARARRFCAKANMMVLWRSHVIGERRRRWQATGVAWLHGRAGGGGGGGCVCDAASCAGEAHAGVCGVAAAGLPAAGEACVPACGRPAQRALCAVTTVLIVAAHATARSRNACRCSDLARHHPQ